MHSCCMCVHCLHKLSAEDFSRVPDALNCLACFLEGMRALKFEEAEIIFYGALLKKLTSLILKQDSINST